jgi:starvation-inducible DNA-binding protein
MTNTCMRTLSETELESLRQDLTAVLGELFELHVQGVEAHAHFVGTRFTGVQHQLEAIVQTARQASEAVAEALRDCDRDRPGGGLIITGGPQSVQGLRPGERCTTAAAKMITHRISRVLNTIREVCNQRANADSVVVALLGPIADTVDKQALMLAAESRRINLATRWDPRDER